MEDGTWMLWENSSVVVVVAVVAAVLARYFLNNFLKKSSFLVIFHQKLTFCDIFVLKVVFSPKNFRRRPYPRTLVLLFFRKYAYFIKKSSFLSKKLKFLVKKRHFWLKNCRAYSFFFKGRFFRQEFSPKARLPVV